MTASQFALTAVPAFAASLVEFVEALTIVLAVGVTIGWRPALRGAAGATLLLAAVVGAFGPALARIPQAAFETVVGSLLVLFGLRWLRKAALRSAGVIPLHDEAKAFAAASQSLGAERSAGDRAAEWSGTVTSFNAVALEGTEVAFIVLALGRSGSSLAAACLGAGIALVAVVALGAAIHRPLAKVPENALKIVVGVMLSALGTFWAAEGLGMAWPGGDAAVLLLIAAYACTTALAVAGARAARRGATAP